MANSASLRTYGGPRGSTAAACADAGHRGPVSPLRAAAATAASGVAPVFRARRLACIMPRIGLLRYGGTVSLNQMRYTIRAIPTFGSTGSDRWCRGIP
jgi:hypothetical protein